VFGFDGTLRGAVVTVLSDSYLFVMTPKRMKKKKLMLPINRWQKFFFFAAKFRVESENVY